MVDGYILCGTPRSGSTLLCGLLAAAGAGAPDSFFRPENCDEWAAEWGLAPTAAAGEATTPAPGGTAPGAPPYFVAPMARPAASAGAGEATAPDAAAPDSAASPAGAAALSAANSPTAPTVADRIPALDFDARYLAAAIAAGRGGTPVFGLRLMHENLGGLVGLIDRLHPGLPSDRARLERAFGRLVYVHLSRADRLAQAISRVKAEQTGLWHRAPDGREIERLGPPAPPRYDFARLRREVGALEAADAGWRAWFEAEAIAPLAVDYDALSADPAGTVARICAALGLAPPPAATLTPAVARLADATSAEWARRYRAEMGGLGSGEPRGSNDHPV